jgi:carboxylate-amine ligase
MLSTSADATDTDEERAAATDFTVGVEEEFFVVDSTTGELRSDAERLIEGATAPPGHQIDHELKRSQVETGTEVCEDLDTLRTSISRLRTELARSASSVDAAVLAAGTHPVAHWVRDGGVAAEPAYQRLQETFAQLTDEQLVCGCHVHVAVVDPELAIDVLNRCRQWVPLLIALSANSPFWLGRDTGYASYRTVVFHRWPVAGIPPQFADRADYDATLADLRAAGAIDSPGRVYWDLRPSATYPTIEVRTADVMTTVDEVVGYAALVRGLIETVHADALADRPYTATRPELLRAAWWRAARFGMAEQLVDPATRTLVPAATHALDLLELARSALEERGDWTAASDFVARCVGDGTGADRQRRRHRATGDLRAGLADLMLPAPTPAT